MQIVNKEPELRRGTTPTHTFTLPFPVEEIQSVQIVYSQGERIVLTKKTQDLSLEGNKVSFKMTQEESLSFVESRNAELQLRALTVSGEALASSIIPLRISRCLDNEVIG